VGLVVLCKAVCRIETKGCKWANNIPGCGEEKADDEEALAVEEALLLGLNLGCSLKGTERKQKYNLNMQLGYEYCTRLVSGSFATSNLSRLSLIQIICSHYKAKFYA
jgi:hypothetical protein